MSPTDVFVPMIPSMLCGHRRRPGPGLAAGTRRTPAHRTRRAARRPGRRRGTGPGTGHRWGHARHRRSRAARHGVLAGQPAAPSAVATVAAPATADDATDPESDFAHASAALPDLGTTARPKLIWFNLGLTLAVMALLVADLLPVPFVFMVAVGIALVVNFRHVSQQAHQLKAHAGSVVRWSPWCWPPPYSPASFPGPAWSPRWPTGSSP